MVQKSEEEIRTGPICMTKKAIETLCKKNKLYVTPRLNDVLYLHYQGYQKIESLEEYTELKCLWLECNAITNIQGLENQKQLRCLFLQNNFIKKIENLHHCAQLDTLNLSHNYVNSIENCGSDILPVLNTLNLSHNSLKTASGVEKLIECKSVSVLDLSHNRLNDITIVKTLAKMPELRVLVLTGNPIINEIPQYRKTLIIECKNLTYLDSRPVFDKDRACAEAWKRGGYEAEKKELEKWNKAERRKIRNSVRATLAFSRLKKGIAVTDDLPSSSDDEDVEDRKYNTSNESETKAIADDYSNNNQIGEIEVNSTEEMDNINPMEIKTSNELPTDKANHPEIVLKQIERANEAVRTMETTKIEQEIEDKSTGDRRSFIDVDAANPNYLQIVDKTEQSKGSSNKSLLDYIYSNNLGAGRKFLKKPLIEVIASSEDDDSTMKAAKADGIKIKEMKNIETKDIAVSELHTDQGDGDYNKDEDSFKAQQITDQQLIDNITDETIISPDSNNNRIFVEIMEDRSYFESKGITEKELKQRNDEIVHERGNSSLESVNDSENSSSELPNDLQKFDKSTCDDVAAISNSDSFHLKSSTSISSVTFYCENLDSLKEYNE